MFEKSLTSLNHLLICNYTNDIEYHANEINPIGVPKNKTN